MAKMSTGSFVALANGGVGPQAMFRGPQAGREIDLDLDVTDRGPYAVEHEARADARGYG